MLQNNNRILNICSPQSGLDPESNYGGCVHDREILKGLAELGAKIYIPMYGKDQKYIDTINWIVKKTNFKKYYGLGSFFPTIVFLFYIYKINKKNRIHVLRLYSLSLGYLGFFVKKIFNIPVVWNIHHLDDLSYEKRQLKLFGNIFDLITTVSEATKKELTQKYNIDEQRIHVIYNGISQNYRPLPKDDQLLKDFNLTGKTTLLFLGRLHPRKNLEFLVKIFAELVVKKKDEINLVICGSGVPNYEESIKELIANLKLNRQIILTGKVSEKEKIKWINTADIFVFPSLKEGFGLAPAEAMSCGKPVVCSNSDALMEVVKDGITGFAFSPNDKDGFVQGICNLIDNDELRVKMGKEGRKRVLENFQWSVASEKTLNIYNKLVKNYNCF